MSNEDLQPDVQEVLQSEEYEPVSVSVCVEKIKTPVRTQPLPRKQGATGTRTIDALASVPLLKPDPNRASVLIISIAEDFYIAFNPQSAEDTRSMQRWPKLVPYPVDVDSGIYVRAFQNTTDLSFSTRLWAVGEM